MSVYTRRIHFWEHQLNSFSLEARKYSKFWMLFKKMCSKFSSENQFWEYQFFSKIVSSELGASFFAAITPMFFLKFSAILFLSQFWRETSQRCCASYF